MVYLPHLRLPPGLGRAFWLALLLVSMVELAMHSEWVIHRYRAVFAIGRAYDKLHHIESVPPQVLFLGNSRTDNGIDPRTVSKSWANNHASGFNLGLPGANAIVYQGELKRLDDRGLLGMQAIHTVVIGLDESALQEDNSLGYIGFLADRTALLESGRYLDWLGSYFRLWSYSANLRQLREPEKLFRFVESSMHEVDAVGGDASACHGYRVGFGSTQNAIQVARQESASQRPPSPDVVSFLWRGIDILKSRGVRIFVTIPPLRDRPSAFVDQSHASEPYRALIDQLRERGVNVLPVAGDFMPSEFVNAGHLNDRGAQRYSALLGRQLAATGSR